MKLTCVNYLLRADSFRRIHALPLRVRRVIKCSPAVQLYCASGVHNFAQYLAEISQYLITITKRLRADKSANGLRLPLSERGTPCGYHFPFTLRCTFLKYAIFIKVYVLCTLDSFQAKVRSLAGSHTMVLGTGLTLPQDSKLFLTCARNIITL